MSRKGDCWDNAVAAFASLRMGTAGSEMFVWGMALFSAFRTLVAGGLLARKAWAYDRYGKMPRFE